MAPTDRSNLAGEHLLEGSRRRAGVFGAPNGLTNSKKIRARLNQRLHYVRSAGTQRRDQSERNPAREGDYHRDGEHSTVDRGVRHPSHRVA